MKGSVGELERAVATLRRQLSGTEARAGELQAAIAQIEEQKAEVAGRLTLAQQEAADLARLLETRERELEEARQQADYDMFLDAVKQRDAATAEAATLLAASLDGLEQVDRCRDQVTAARARVHRRFNPVVPDEPVAFTEAWERLTGVVRRQLDVRLEDELLDAAAHDPLGHAIGQLPVHLQQAARRRREDVLAEVKRKARH